MTLPDLPRRSSAPTISELRRALAREMVKHIGASPHPARPDNADMPRWVGAQARCLLSPLRTLHTGAHKSHPIVSSAALGVVGEPWALRTALTQALDLLLAPGFLPPQTGWRSFYERCRRFIELRARIEWALDLNPDPTPHWRDDPAAFEGLHPYYLNFPPSDEGDEEDLP